VDNGYFGTCGLRAGGQGKWGKAPGPRCQLEVTSAGLMEYLNKLTGYMKGWFKIGLYVNDHVPKLTDTISLYQQANFSGYQGAMLLYGFGQATMFGVRAKSVATTVVWTHDGGPIANDVYGYFVVNNKGILAFAERFCDGPFTVDRAGRSVKVKPVFSTKNEREEDS